MGPALDQSFLVQFVEHAYQRDRLDAKPSRNLGLADAFVAGDVEHDCRLLTGDRQPHLSRPTLEPPLDQPRDIVDEKPEGAADFGPASLELPVRQRRLT